MIRNHGVRAVKRFAACGSSQHLTKHRHLSSVSASMVKELRDRMGAPMMQCKKALSDPQVNGDMKLAEEWLRKNGVELAKKKSGRSTNEGLIGVQVSESKREASIVEVCSETDFVARNEVFQSLVDSVAKSCLDNRAESAEDLLKVDCGGMLVEAAVTECTATVGELIGIRNAKTIAVNNGVVGVYIHNKRGASAGTQGAVVAIESEKAIQGETLEKASNLATALALHLVGGQAMFLDDVPKDVLDSEKALEVERFLKQAREKDPEGDEEVLQKRAGKKADKVLKKMVDEQVLFRQQLLTSENTDLKGKVSKILQSLSKAHKSTFTIPIAVRFQIGQEPAILTPVKK